MSTVKARFFLLLILSLGAAHLTAGQSIPRMPDGKPKFSGVWAGPAFLHVVGPDDTDTPHVTNFDRGSMASFLPGGEAKLLPRPTGDLRHDDPTALCLPDGHPRQALVGDAQQILQTSDSVII